MGLCRLHEKMDAVHAALCDSINTPVAVDEIMELISQANKYMANGADVVNIDVLEDVANYVSRMMQVRLTEGVYEV